MMWYTFIVSGDEIEDGKAFKGGKGRAGAIYSWKGRQLHEKVYLSPLRAGGPTGQRLTSLPNVKN
jgi:hypothetical protein